MDDLLTNLAAAAFLLYAFSLGGIPVLVWRHAGQAWGVLFALIAVAYWCVSWFWPHQSINAVQAGVPLAEGDSIRAILSTIIISGGLGLLVLRWHKEEK